jgi:hypothetical protein
MAAQGIIAVGALGLLVLTTGCAMLPASGPSTLEVTSEAASESPTGGYVLLDVDERIVSISAAQPRESFRGVFHDVGPAPDLRIGVSDSVCRNDLGGRGRRPVLGVGKRTIDFGGIADRDHPRAGGRA